MSGAFWWNSGDVDAIKPQTDMHAQPFVNTVRVVGARFNDRVSN